MCKYLLTIILSFLIVQPLFSQAEAELSIKPRIGVMFSKVDGTFVDFVSDVAHDPKFKIGLAVGSELHYQTKSLWGASIGLFYERKGSSFSAFTKFNNNSKWVYSDESLDLEYLSVPVFATVKIGGTGVMLKAGLQVGFLLSAEHKYAIDKYIWKNSTWTFDADASERESMDVADLCNKFNFSIPIGVSYEYKNFVIDAEYSIGVMKVNNKTTNNIHNDCISVSVGYKINLK